MALETEVNVRRVRRTPFERRKKLTVAADEYQRFVHAADSFPCEHGHPDCSYRNDGPCFDELKTRYPELISPRY